MKIVADRDILFLQDYFADIAELVLLDGRHIGKEDVQDADVLLVRAVTKVDSDLLSDSSVRFVGSMTAGYDHLDTVWLDKQNISYCTTPGFNAPAVSDYVICVIAALQRRCLLNQHGTRAAVIGVGHTGSLTAKKLAALGMEVIACDPIRALADKNFKHTPLSEINQVDLISLHVPLTEEGEHATKYMIGKDFLEKQKVGCVLLNASRGAVLNTQELLQVPDALQVCLDVYEEEPNISLESLSRAIIATPHIAGYSVQAKRRGVEMLYNQLLSLGMITRPLPESISLPRQQLKFAGTKHHWQDVVMGIFNPVLMTALFKEQSLRKNVAAAFDEMRKAFDYRHEFAFTDVVSEDLLFEDRRVLEGLGIECVSIDGSGSSRITRH